MKFLIPFLWLWLATALVAAPKYAIVRVTDIYRDLPSTKVMLAKVKADNDAILSDKRANQFRAIMEELKALQTQLEQSRDELETEDGKNLVRSFELKRQEAETLRNAVDEFRGDEEKRINREMVGKMRSTLTRITEAAQQIATERNIEAVFDTSGNSNTGVPFVLYSGSAPDLTDDVIALLSTQDIEKEATAQMAESTPETEEPTTQQ